jgi:Fe2+ transport system protein B
MKKEVHSISIGIVTSLIVMFFTVVLAVVIGNELSTLIDSTIYHLQHPVMSPICIDN